MTIVDTGCGCGCSTMTNLTKAAEPCLCECECCSTPPHTPEEEVAELRRLRDQIEVRLGELEAS